MSNALISFGITLLLVLLMAFAPNILLNIMIGFVFLFVFGVLWLMVYGVIRSVRED